MNTQNEIDMDADLVELQPWFLQNRMTEFSGVRQLIENDNFDSLRRIGHNLKGVSASYGFPTLGDLGHQLELASTEKQKADVTLIVGKICSALEVECSQRGLLDK